MADCKAPTGTITGKPAMRLDWQTPQHILDCARTYWGGAIPFDAATAEDNPTRADRYATTDGLERPWPVAAWCNPPYGKVLREWLVKMKDEATGAPARGDKAIASLMREAYAAGDPASWWRYLEAMGRTEALTLLPCARWEQAYFTDALAAANAMCLIRGRVKFINPATGDAVSGNPYANMVLGFNVHRPRFRAAFGQLGRCFSLEAMA